MILTIDLCSDACEIDIFVGLKSQRIKRRSETIIWMEEQEEVFDLAVEAASVW